MNGAWYEIDANEQDSPALLIYPERVKENIRILVSMIDDINRLRPHVKTNKSKEACQLMMDAGIKKFKCATIAEAEMLATIDAQDILLAYQPVGPKLKRFAGLVKKYPSVRFSCLVDNQHSSTEMDKIFSEAGVIIEVYLDLNVGMNRTGIAPGDEAFQLYVSCNSMSGIKAVGLHIYDGHIRDNDFEKRTKKCDEAFQVGLSWIISEEGFLQGATGWLNELKYKVSYGSVGNQFGIGNFASRELYGPTVYAGQGGLLLANLPNPDLRWEKKLMFNTGLEFTLFAGRLGGTVEYYNNTTKDLFLDRQLSRTSGFTSINTNLGRLQNQGIEASLTGTVVRMKDFSWSISLNHTYNKNKIVEQPGQPENISGIYINKEGERANSIYIVRYAGVDAQTGDALYYKLDGKTTTNIYDPSDAVIVGTIDPPHFGGASTTINFKGIELDVLFTYAKGSVVYNNDRFNVEYPGYWYSRLATSLLREWQTPGQVTDIPSPFNDFHEETTRFVEETDHIRLRNVMLSYNLPSSLLSRVKITSLRIFAQGQNLKVWHNFQGYDPEVTTGILGGAQYPQLKTITVGLNLGL